MGGVDKDGNDASNKVTYMMLQSMARLVLHDPRSLSGYIRTPRRSSGRPPSKPQKSAAASPPLKTTT
jgi:hypothetical protein